MRKGPLSKNNLLRQNFEIHSLGAQASVNAFVCWIVTISPISTHVITLISWLACVFWIDIRDNWYLGVHTVFRCRYRCRVSFIGCRWQIQWGFCLICGRFKCIVMPVYRLGFVGIWWGTKGFACSIWCLSWICFTCRLWQRRKSFLSGFSSVFFIFSACLVHFPVRVVKIYNDYIWKSMLKVNI